jgi:hypothetical protein
MNKQQAQAAFNQEYIKKQKEEIFPEEFLPANYSLWKHAALNFVSIFIIRSNFPISWNEYKVLLTKEKKYSLFEIHLINTILEQRTPNELDRLIEDNFYHVMDEVIKMNKRWADIMKPEEESIAKKIEIMSASQKGNYKEGQLKMINGNKNHFE